MHARVLLLAPSSFPSPFSFLFSLSSDIYVTARAAETGADTYVCASMQTSRQGAEVEARGRRLVSSSCLRARNGQEADVNVSWNYPAIMQPSILTYMSE